MIQTYTFRYIYLAEIQSLRTIEKNTIFNTLEQQIYRTSFFPSFQKKKKKSSFKSSIYFNSFPPIIPFYRGLNGKPIVSVGGARIEGKREREKKRGRRRIETESETMYIQAVHSRSKRLTTEERNVGQSGKINHRIEQEETEKIKRSKLGWKIVVYIYIYILSWLSRFFFFSSYQWIYIYHSGRWAKLNEKSINRGGLF